MRDVIETTGEHVDALKLTGGSFTPMPERALREIIEIAHEHDVLPSRRSEFSSAPAAPPPRKSLRRRAPATSAPRSISPGVAWKPARA